MNGKSVPKPTRVEIDPELVRFPFPFPLQAVAHA